MTNTSVQIIKRTLALFVVVWMSVLSPMTALAAECVGFGCGGEQESTSSTPTTQTSVGAIGFNANTGADSTNAIESNVENDKATTVSNEANDATTATAEGNTGSNTANQNSGTGEITTGDAGIGVTSVKNDNTTVLGGQAGLDVSGHNGDYNGDYTIGFGSSTADLSGGGSYQAVNDTTGAGSDNTIGFKTKVTETTEVQNDGKIDNILNLFAITGQNDASMNTGGGKIMTGDANVAATLVNLLNTTVRNGSLMVSVADIFGDLLGDIHLPDLNALAYALAGGAPTIVAGNENTGEDSTNRINVDLHERETTAVDNTALVTTEVNADAITGQNDAGMNTGGGFVETGDAAVSASNITLANTTVEGGNWGVVVVNWLNGFLAFLVGQNGEVRALSQDETIEAFNRNTGADSTNEIAISDERERTTLVNNNAFINNEVNAEAITGQNTANYNTGAGDIATGDANITATAVNIANTTVKDGSLFIAVVNIMGDWFGDLFYDGNQLAGAAHSTGSGQANIAAANTNTGAGSENTVDINIDRSHETDIDNEARIHTALNANVDTGNNTANKNTKGGSIETGDGFLALHSRAVANLTGIAVDPALGIAISGLNDTTGFDSTNRILANLNDHRVISVDNFADISTIFASLVNTGDNEASYNTLGGHIGTGNIDANVGIHNLINRVILALAGKNVVVDAEFVNRLTGALSENTNEAIAHYDFLADIANTGLVNNLIDLLLNTGGNAANENTLGAAIATGRICFEGNIQNTVNQNTVTGSNSFGVNAEAANEITGWESDNSNAVDLDSSHDVNVANAAAVNNQADIQATTGNNETNRNTVGGDLEGPDGCPIAQAPTPTPAPGPGGEQPKEEDKGGGEGGPDTTSGAGQGGGEEGGKVAGVTEKKPGKINGGMKLRRFPVAGSMVGSQWMQGKRAFPWIGLALAGLTVVGAAGHLDRRARRQRFALENRN